MESMVRSKKFKETYRYAPSNFIRNRIFTFTTVIIMKINIISKSLSVEITKFLERFHFRGKEMDGSKQGMSQASAKVKWEAYLALNNEFVKDYYSDQEYNKFKDKYLIIASDGTTYELPYEKKLIKEFRTFNNGQSR